MKKRDMTQEYYKIDGSVKNEKRFEEICTEVFTGPDFLEFLADAEGAMQYFDSNPRFKKVQGEEITCKIPLNILRTLMIGVARNYQIGDPFGSIFDAIAVGYLARSLREKGN